MISGINMTFTDERLSTIYDKTDGYCEYCGKKIAWKNYGRIGERGAWEVDHSNPVSRGGTDHLNNLFPACISCNREKSDLTGKQFRASIKNEENASFGDFLWDIGVATIGAGLMDSFFRKER